MSAKTQKVFLVDGVRTVIGKPFKSLKKYKAVDLAAGVIEGLKSRVSFSSQSIDQVIVGNTLSSGLGQNFAREAVFLSGLPVTVPAYVVDNVCGASLEGLILGCDSILAQRNHAVLCIGAESITYSPFLVSKEKVDAVTSADCRETLREDGLYCRMSHKLMGELAEALAEKHNISRERQDAFALESHKKAKAAMEKGLFLHEIVPLSEETLEDLNDDCISKKISMERLEMLPPAFCEGGTLTAGNSSRICDGAAGVLLASETFVEEQGLYPRAEILQAVSVAGDPSDTYAFGVDAINLCLRKEGLKVSDIESFEICEAFASQILYTQDVLGIPSSKLNFFGGDIALGHPMGASGLRALVTLLNVLTQQQKTTGIACVSFGSGGAIAVLIKKSEEKKEEK